MPYIKRVPQELQCRQCFSLFTPKIFHPRYKFCSSTCKDKYNKSKIEYKEARRIHSKKKHLENPAARRERDRNRYLSNKELYYENNAKRRYLVRNKSTPSWEEELTSFVYQEAHRLRKLRNNLTNIEWHVDHIIPVQGIDVSGLHVWNNFAVIPKVENLHKGNRNSIHA